MYIVWCMYILWIHMYNSVYLTAGCRPSVTTSKYSSQLWGHARLAESQGFSLWIPAMTNRSMGNSTTPPFSRILRDSPMIFPWVFQAPDRFRNFACSTALAPEGATSLRSPLELCHYSRTTPALRGKLLPVAINQPISCPSWGLLWLKLMVQQEACLVGGPYII